MRGPLYLSLLILTILLGNAPNVHSMIGETSFTIHSHEGFSRLFQFEYDAGGSLAMAVEIEKPTVKGYTLQFLLLTGAELDPILKLQLSDVCSTPQYTGQVEWITTLGDSHPLRAQLPGNFTIRDSDWYYLYALNCNGSILSGSISYIAINPGGEYLSMSEVPYKLMYIICFIAWIIATLFWIIWWWRYRVFNISLQRIMTLLPLSKALLAIPSEFYWRIASETGTYPEDWERYQDFAECLDRFTFFLVLILLARGYSITIDSLGSHDKRTIALYLIPLVAAYILYIVNEGLWLFLLVTVYIFIFRYLFSHVMLNTYTLLRQFQILTMAGVDALITPLASKLHMFKLLQVALVMYISVDVVFHLWSSIFLTSIPWVGDGMENLMSLLLWLMCIYAFGMRPFNPYYYQIVQLFGKYSEDPEETRRTNVADSSSATVNPEHIADLSRLAAEHSSSGPRLSVPIDSVYPSLTTSDRSVSIRVDDENTISQSQSIYSGGSQIHSPTPNNSSSAYGYVPLWKAGMSVPPLPEHPKDWLFEDTNDTPILILENPYAPDDDFHRSLPAVYAAQHVNDNADLSKIPREALVYLPPSLIALLEKRVQLQSPPANANPQSPTPALTSRSPFSSSLPFRRNRAPTRSSNGDVYVRLMNAEEEEPPVLGSYDINLQSLRNPRRNAS